MATTTRRSVTMNVSGTDQRMAKIGNRVTVTLPNSKKVNGKVVAVGQSANDTDMDAANQSGTGGPSNTGELSGATQGIPVMINLMNHDALGKIANTGVSVQYVAATRRNVLAVPVQALVALAEGGYGLEIRDTPTPRVVAVKVGLFAGAKVEVTGGGITEGTTIGMAE